MRGRGLGKSKIRVVAGRVSGESIRRGDGLRYSESLILAKPVVVLPETLPVMLLSRCNLMPHGMLPLFIFEPRYRELLQHVLRMDRMFCVGFLSGEEESDEGIDSFSTAGLVRACIGHEDGTAHLVLQGVKRVRLKSWKQREPFRLAEVVPLQTSVKDEGEVVELSALLMERAAEVLRRGGAAEMAERVGSIEDPEVLADFVAANFLGDASLRQPLLGMSVLDERLRYLLEVFQGEV